MSNSKKRSKKVKVTTAEELLKTYKRKPDEELWAEIQKNSKGNERQKCDAVRAILTNFYNTPKEADELVKKLVAGNPTVRVEVAKLLQEGQKHFSSAVYFDLLETLRKDDDPFVKKVMAAENKKLNELLKPAFDAIKAIGKMSEQITSFVKTSAAMSKRINRIMRNIPKIRYPATIPIDALASPVWEEEREKLLSYITTLENQLRKERKEKQKLLKIIQESKKRFKKKTGYVA